MRITGRVKGAADIAKRLAKAEEKARKKGVRKGLTRGSREVIREARSKVPERYGVLKRSIGRRVKSYRSSGVIFNVIGPRTNSGIPDPEGGETAAGRGKRIVPTLYSHLVEFGTRRSAATPFMRPAWLSKARRFERILQIETARALRSAGG